MPGWKDIDSVDKFGPGDSRLVDLDDTSIAVINLGGEYFALEDVCSHDGSALLGSGLAAGDVIHGGEIVCPRHGARFCIRTGKALAPPAFEPVLKFPVRVENGMVQIKDPREDRANPYKSP